MDREILFRGFCPDENGTQEIWTDGTCNGEKVKGGIKGEWIEGYSFKSWDKCYILWGTTNDIPNMIEVIPETVGQWTGLTDKNGKKIFEHNRIKDDKGQIGIIFYSTENARFLVNWKMKDGNYETDDCFGYGEVIGTIFDEEAQDGQR